MPTRTKRTVKQPPPETGLTTNNSENENGTNSENEPPPPQNKGKGKTPSTNRGKGPGTSKRSKARSSKTEPSKASRPKVKEKARAAILSYIKPEFYQRLNRIEYVLSRIGFVEEKSYLYNYDVRVIEKQFETVLQREMNKLNFNKKEKEYLNLINKFSYNTNFATNRVTRANRKNRRNDVINSLSFGINYQKTYQREALKEKNKHNLQEARNKLKNLRLKKTELEKKILLEKQKLLDTYFRMYNDPAKHYVPYTKDSIISRHKYLLLWYTKQLRKPVKFPNAMVTN